MPGHHSDIIALSWHLCMPWCPSCSQSSARFGALSVCYAKKFSWDVGDGMVDSALVSDGIEEFLVAGYWKHITCAHMALYMCHVTVLVAVQGVKHRYVRPQINQRATSCSKLFKE